MALVCDHKSEPSEVEPNEVNLEDGEIEDGEIEDDDEVVPEPPAVENAAPTTGSTPKTDEKIDRDRPRDKSREHRDKRHRDKEPRHMTEAEKSILHLRRKEKMERDREKWNRRKEHLNVEPQDDFAKKLEITLASILKKDRNTSDDDKDEERRGVKRKKKDKDNDHGAKHHKSDSQSEVDEKEMLNVKGGSPDQMDHDGDDKGFPEGYFDPEEVQKRQEAAKKRRRIKRKEKAKMKKEEKASKDNKNNIKEVKIADGAVNSKGICIFYLNGKCNKNDCIYSHEAVPPMKLELCKFYLSDCCAKGDNCFYMHSDFPCKFYHLGLPCKMGDKCKFAHGEPLSDGLKQILFKHIETAPRDILGGFPRLSREETLQMMDNTQKTLMDMYKERSPSDNDDNKASKEEETLPSLLNINVPIPSELNDTKIKLADKAGRHKPSRWQAAEPKEKMAAGPVNFSPFNFSKDQDMRITSNGDVDMRTLPPHPLSSLPQPLPSSLMSTDLSRMNTNPVRNATGDVDIRNMPPNFASDIDIRMQSSFEVPPMARQDQSLSFLGNKDVDIRQFSAPPPSTPMDDGRGSQNVKNDADLNLPPNMPKMQRDLYLRIHSQQKENPPVYNDYNDNKDDDGNDEDWYSDDDEEHRLIIKEDNEAAEQKEERTETVKFPCLPTITPLPVQPQEVVEKLGDLSKIKITADISKLLSSISSLPAVKTPETPRDPRQLHKGQGGISSPSRSPTSSNTGSPAPLAPRTLFDPRLSAQDPKVNQASEAPRDPRRTNSVAGKTEKISIYEQGGLNMEEGEASEEYKASSRPDVDLRTMGLKFKGVESYTPAKEIDASFNTHKPIPWKVIEVDVPRPDYSGLKLSLEEAEKNGDPRLRKIFRLSVDEERDTPLSPLASPQRPTGVRLDPRLRKAEEAKSTNPAPDASSMNYSQQLNTLQSSAFYQSLTTNQKLMLNQELSSRSDQTGSHDSILNNILASLNLIPSIGGGGAPLMHPQGHNFGVANNILQNISKMNHMGGANMMNPNAMLGQMSQPGLLGAAPGIPNMPQQDYPMNFDPRAQNGLLGNRPPQQFPNFEPPPNQGFQNYPNDDYYPQESNQGGFRGNQGRNDRGGGNFNPRERRRGGRNNNFGRNPPNRNQFKNRNQGGNRSNKNHNQS